MIAQQLFNGLTIGVIYAMVALGYTLSYGILRLINFAHGDVYMVGAFVGFFGVAILGLHPLLAFAISLGVCGLLGALIEFAAFRSVRGGARSSQLISAIGVSIVLQNLVMLTSGSDTKSFPTVLVNNTFDVAGVTMSSTALILMGVSVVLMVLLYLFIYKTRMGIHMRAAAQDPAMTSLMGISVNKVISVTFSIGSVLGGAAGILVGMYYNTIVFTMGYTMGLKAFVAAILGGIGNVPGAMLGGVLLGMSESMGALLTSAKYKDAVAFVILILVLLVKPTGLFGKKEVEKV